MRLSPQVIWSVVLAAVLAFTAISGCSGVGKENPSVHAFFNIEVQVYDPVLKSYSQNVPVYLVSYRAGTNDERDQHITQYTDQNGVARFVVDYVVDKENAVIFIGASTNKSFVEGDFKERDPKYGPPVPGEIGLWLFYNYDSVTLLKTDLKEVNVDRIVIVNPTTGKITNN